MIEGFQWLIEPFERIALDTVGIWYFVTVVVMVGLSAIAEKAFGLENEDPFPDDWGLGMMLFTAAVVAPILEEGLFRILPMKLGFGVAAIVACSVVWAFLHGKRWLFIMITVPLYVKLALSGFFVELILLHAFHNTWAVVAYYIGEKYIGDNESGEQRDLEAIEDDEELLDEIVHRMEHDDDFDPKVTINGTTYDSFADVPIREVREYLEDDE